MILIVADSLKKGPGVVLFLFACYTCTFFPCTRGVFHFNKIDTIYTSDYIHICSSYFTFMWI